jgi:hypothetical protein
MAKKADPYAKALKKDPKLPDYIKQRKGLKKGTPEYNTVQNKINRAYGKQTRPEKAATLPQRTGQESTNNVKPAKPKKSTPSTPKQKPGLERMLDKAGEKARAKAAQRKADKEKKKKDKEARKTTREVTDDGTQTTKTIKKFDKEGNLKKTKTKIKKSKPKRVKRRDKKGKVTANMPAVDVVG